jgi:hypothetical protein
MKDNIILNLHMSQYVSSKDKTILTNKFSVLGSVIFITSSLSSLNIQLTEYWELLIYLLNK